MDENQISGEKKLTLLLLCWLLGIFGVHRFYSGKYLTGSLQLGGLALAGLLMVLDAGIFQIILLLAVFLSVVVDFFLIVMGRFTDKEGRLIIDWV
jgi:TM2 domain-containing membrane protein YozV